MPFCICLYLVLSCSPFVINSLLQLFILIGSDALTVLQKKKNTVPFFFQALLLLTICLCALGAEEGRRYIERTVSKHLEMVGSIRELSDRLMGLEAKLKVTHIHTHAP